MDFRFVPSNWLVIVSWRDPRQRCALKEMFEMNVLFVPLVDEPYQK